MAGETRRTHAVLVALAVLVLVPARAVVVSGQQFYPDDPLVAEPPPEPVINPQPRALSEALELMGNSLGQPGERHPRPAVIPAQGVNTLGEVLDGPWFVNRHGTHRMTRDALVRGPEPVLPPSTDTPWQVVTLKRSGVLPGILIRDARHEMYLLRFDPEGHSEMATGADVVVTRFLHALGYHVPASHLVYFDRDQLVAAGGQMVSTAGNTRPLLDVDVDVFLRGVAQQRDGGYRAAAARLPAHLGEPLGPFQWYGTRGDDPNDVVPHEHRRDLRGLHVIAAWLNHTRVRATNTLDILTDDDGIPHIRHLLINFVGALGSGPDGPKQGWEGFEPVYDGAASWRHAWSFGVISPAWAGETNRGGPSVGRFGFDAFAPDAWIPLERLAPFENRLPDDTYWAARQVLAFTDDDIRAIVATGEYTDPEAEAWIATSLIERRDRIGRAYLPRVLPLDEFRVEDATLVFTDWGERYGGAPRADPLSVEWLSVDNENGMLSRLSLTDDTFAVPPAVSGGQADAYFAARIFGPDEETHVTVYLRGGGTEIVGIDRGWPGKRLADARRDADPVPERFTRLLPEQQELYATYAEADNARTGDGLTPDAHYAQLSISEHTTYEAVTHALLRSRLTDRDGNDLGRAFDLVERVDRVAGHYYGRGGDQQFRLYVGLIPEAVTRLEQSDEFFRDHENTVYHAGYPHSFRQSGSAPTMQFSVADDGRSADIDVDYRSSRPPAVLFDGHLTSANSDVRAGDNLRRHNGRWQGLVGWWQDLFDQISIGATELGHLLARDHHGLLTPTPPDRPIGAEITDVHEAVQEFLADWLVRRQLDESLAMLSDLASACLHLDDDRRATPVTEGAARRQFRGILRHTIDQHDHATSLTEIIEAVEPFNTDHAVTSHPFEAEFTLLPLSDDEVGRYACDETAARPGAADERYEVLFRFKHQTGGVLGLLWARESAAWRVTSYRIFEH